MDLCHPRQFYFVALVGQEPGNGFLQPQALSQGAAFSGLRALNSNKLFSPSCLNCPQLPSGSGFKG